MRFQFISKLLQLRDKITLFSYSLKFRKLPETTQTHESRKN